MRTIIALLCLFAASAQALDELPGQWQQFGGVSFGCNGRINDIALAPSGLLYLGGNFTVCGDQAAAYVVAYDPTTEEFTPLGSGVSSSVLSVEVVGSDVFVGGLFLNAGGQFLPSIAKWDGSQWSGVGSLQGGWVYSLAWDNGFLYAGGTFTQADGAPANRVARWDGQDWTSLGSGAANGVNDRVRAVAVWNGRVYLGGDFTEAGGAPASRIASWGTGGWQALSDTVGEGVDHATEEAEVTALAASSGGLYVGGRFEQAGDQVARSVARWSGAAWSGLDSGGAGGVTLAGQAGRVFDLQSAGSDVYVAGLFESAGSTTANHVARWDGSQWHPIGTGPENGLNGAALALLHDSGELYVGGFNVHGAGSVAVNRIARWTGSAWTTVGPGGHSGLGGQVAAALFDGGDLYVGGNFGLAGEASARHVARWDGEAWHALGLDSLNGTVSAMTLWNGDLVIIGSFTRIGDNAMQRVARWDGNQWHALGEGFDRTPWAIHGNEDDLCVGGPNSLASGVTALNGIACWDGTDWQPLGDGLMSGGFATVYALARWNGQLYAGGSFDQMGQAAASNIAVWDGAAWSSVGTLPDEGVDGFIRALLPQKGELYVVGDFSTAGQIAAENLALWDGSSWSAPASPVDRDVWSIAPLGAGTVAGGEFFQVTSPATEPLSRVGYLHNGAWHTLGTGASQGVFGRRVQTLATSGSTVALGGRISLAGGDLSSGLAIFLAQDFLFSDRFSD